MVICLGSYILESRLPSAIHTHGDSAFIESVPKETHVYPNRVQCERGWAISCPQYSAHAMSLGIVWLG